MRPIHGRTRCLVGLFIAAGAWTPAMAQQDANAPAPIPRVPVAADVPGPLPDMPTAPLPTAAETRPASQEPSRSLPTTVDLPNTRSPKFDPMVEQTSARSTDEAPTSTAVHDPVLAASRTQVEVHQQSPPTLSVAKPSVLSITVSNHGTRPVDKVIVTHDLDPMIEVLATEPKSEKNGQTLIWSLGRMEAGSNQEIKLTIQATSAAASEISTRAEVTYTAAVESKIQIIAAKIAAKLQTPSSAMVGQPIDVMIELTNTGTAAATGVALRCELPRQLAHSEGPDLEYEVGKLAPGETRQIPLKLIAQEGGPVAAVLTVAADNLEQIAQPFELTVEDVQVDIDVAGPTKRYLNQPASYQVRVTNQGEAVNDVVLHADLPPGMTFAHASDAGEWNAATSQVEWRFGTLGANETKELNLTAVASNIGEQSLEAVAQVGTRPVARKKTSTDVKGVAALSVEVVDVVDPLETDSETIYEIHLHNQGTLTCSHVAVACDIPAEVEAVAADGPTKQKLVDRKLSFDPLAEFAPQAKAVYRVKCQGRTEGSARFKVTVTADELDSPVHEEENTIIFGG